MNSSGVTTDWKMRWNGRRDKLAQRRGGPALIHPCGMPVLFAIDYEGSYLMLSSDYVLPA